MKKRVFLVKRKVCISLVLALCLMLSVSAVASAAEFHYSFNSEVGTQDSNIGTRTKANGTDWDITITSGSLSSTNILGIRPRRYTTDASIGAYKTYKQTGTWGRQYSVTVKTNWKVVLRGKKDSASTSTGQLTAHGYFTP